jgi:hypothetical protein
MTTYSGDINISGTVQDALGETGVISATFVDTLSAAIDSAGNGTATDTLVGNLSVTINEPGGGVTTQTIPFNLTSPSFPFQLGNFQASQQVPISFMGAVLNVALTGSVDANPSAVTAGASADFSGTYQGVAFSGVVTGSGALTAPLGPTSQLSSAFSAALFVDPSSTLATTPTISLGGGASAPNPMYQDAGALGGLALQVAGGQLTEAQALNTIEHYADATTSVATIAYEFFTGKTPTAAGYDYLVNSAANPDNLNTAYYAQFNEENRYINFAVNLGKDGAGMQSFQDAYGSLDLADAMTKAYTAIFGFAPAAGKIDGLLSAQITPTETRADYFADYGLDGPNGQGTKAAAVGWLMAEAVKADLGTYAQANDHFLAALAGGTAQYNVDLLSVYGAAPVGMVGMAAHAEAAHGMG